MTKVKKFTLIKGTFTREEAQEILMTIFSAKVNFHQLKNFSAKERFGKDDKIAQKRIAALNRSVEKVEQKLAKAKAKNKKLIINSDITISFADN